MHLCFILPCKYICSLSLVVLSLLEILLWPFGNLVFCISAIDCCTLFPLPSDHDFTLLFLSLM